jgi:hypothetical protein
MDHGVLLFSERSNSTFAAQIVDAGDHLDNIDWPECTIQLSTAVAKAPVADLEVPLCYLAPIAGLVCRGQPKLRPSEIEVIVSQAKKRRRQATNTGIEGRRVAA